MAAVFAGTLMSYLVLTAIPALAVAPSCAVNGTNAFQLDVQVGTDNTMVLAVEEAVPVFGGTANTYVVSVNGGAFADCTGVATAAAISYVNILGAGDGNETMVLFHADGQGDGQQINPNPDVITVDLGNGNDTLVWEYGALVTPAHADPGASSNLGLGSAGTVTVADNTVGGVGDTRVDNAENLIVNTGAGSDTVNAQRDSLGANAGNATIATDNVPATTANLQQAITVNGGTSDTGADLFFSGDGSDTFNGGPGVDIVDFDNSPNPVVVDLGAGTSTGQGTDALNDVQVVNGSQFNDTITGSAIDNELNGEDGDDVISGLAGNDLINGGDDDDTLTGGAGNDDVNGNAGDDIVNEEAAANGADNLEGGPGGGCDTINYGARTTSTNINETTGTLWGAAAEGDNGGGFELLVTGSADDTLTGDSSAESFQPGAGNDTVDGNAQGGTDSCLLGFDFLDLSVVAGPANFNLITGTATGNGTDTFSDLEGYVGTNGNDTVVVGDTAANGNTLGDFLGGNGIDTVDATANTLGITIDLSVFGNGQEVENAFGGSGNDTITGNVLNNRLLGNAGNDIISAGTGNDFVEGGLDNDTLIDGGGADRLSYRNAPSGEVIDGANGFASGGDGEDTLVGGWEFILGSNFNDDITGGQNSVNVPTRIKGFKGNDIITGTNSTDTLAGGAGNDEIRAGSGDDSLKGGAGKDLLLAGSGDDRLNGGRGKDRGIGGPGFDVCRGTETEQSCEA
jgi:Ca2+-binding RTX toxin-like protein